MLIAGIYDFPLSQLRGHDKGAALINDNFVYAYEEAKLSTVKDDYISSTPERSLFSGLALSGKDPTNVSLWCFPTPGGGGHGIFQKLM